LDAQSYALDPRWPLIYGDPQAGADALAAAANLDPASSVFRETLLPAIYALAHYPRSIQDSELKQELISNDLFVETLAGWLNTHQPDGSSPARCALEVGCGPGRLLSMLAPLLPEGVVGFDLRLNMLRIARHILAGEEIRLPFRVEGKRFEFVRVSASSRAESAVHLVQGDLVSPPFEAEVFPLVVAVSLLDTVPDPLFALGQLDALLAHGGLLLLASSYHWEVHVTPAADWWSDSATTGPRFLRSALLGRNPALPHFSYEILCESPRISWSLPGHSRVVHRYFLDALIARKH
jgi:SAM-dependent methyltransferase